MPGCRLTCLIRSGKDLGLLRRIVSAWHLTLHLIYNPLASQNRARRLLASATNQQRISKRPPPRRAAVFWSRWTRDTTIAIAPGIAAPRPALWRRTRRLAPNKNPGTPGFRAQFAVSHFASLWRFGQSARI